jgi:hypothetical protein
MKTTHANSETRLHGWPLVVARILVFTALAATTGLFVLTLPASLTSLATPCADPENQCLIGSAQVTSLTSVGLTPQALALAALVLSCLVLLLVDGAAAVLLWQRSDDWMALLAGMTFLLAPMNVIPALHLLQAHTGMWQVPAQILSTASSLALQLLIVLFPNGRFVPRWLWIPSLLLVLTQTPLGDMLPGPKELGALLILGLLVCLGAGQIYRYRRVSTKVERQQTKWVVYGLIVLIGVNQLFWQPYILIPALHQPDSLYLLLSYPADIFTMGLLVITFGIALLRYRLWDIDTLINKTLVYGLLTGILGGLYTGLILALSALAGAISGQVAEKPVVLVLSTLIIATLFRPLRTRIQALIDRRFYRQKYDAEKALAAFRTTSRNAVDLEHIQKHLLAIIQETMQPTSLSLWVNRRPGDPTSLAKTPNADAPMNVVRTVATPKESRER